MRRGPDGSYIMIKEDKELIKKMDREYSRVPGELRWIPKMRKGEIDTLRNKHVGKVCHIVGKGPSLDKIRYIEPGGVIIAINEALHKVESITNENVYGIIQDDGVKVEPKFATLLLNNDIAGWYDFYNQKVHFSPSEFDLTGKPISALIAIKFAELMGCSEIRLYAFDGCLNASLTYAASVGHKVKGDATRFRKHKELLENCTQLPVTWIPTTSKPELHVEGMIGLGDNIFIRAKVKELSKDYKIYLTTPWPQFFYDLGIECVPSQTNLRVYAKNESRQNYCTTEPFWLERKTLNYVDSIKRGKSIYEGLEVDDPNNSKLPIKTSWITDSYDFIPEGVDFVLVKRATVRQDWHCASRNPKEGYIQQLIDNSKEYKIVSLADTKKDAEEFTEENSNIDIAFEHGEVPPEVIVALLSRAKYSIMPVGFMLALCQAINAPAFCIFGGCVRPEIICDRRLICDNVEFVAPEPFCNCFDSRHKCNKEIPNLMDAFKDFKRRHCGQAV